MMSLLFRVVFLLAWSTSAAAQSVDFADCESRMDRLYKAARDGRISVENQDDLDQAREALNEVESRLAQARRACAYSTSVSSYCMVLQSYAMNHGRQAAMKICQQRLESTMPGLCNACLP